MTFHEAQILRHVALMHACNARIEAMKALNASRQDRGAAQAYGEESFVYEADKLERLAACIEADSLNLPTS